MYHDFFLFLSSFHVSLSKMCVFRPFIILRANFLKKTLRKMAVLCTHVCQNKIFWLEEVYRIFVYFRLHFSILSHSSIVYTSPLECLKYVTLFYIFIFYFYFCVFNLMKVDLKSTSLVADRILLYFAEKDPSSPT